MAALAAADAAGEEEEKFAVDVMVLFGNMARLRNYSSLFPREVNLSISIDHVDLSLPTCLLLQIHNGDNFDLMVSPPATSCGAACTAPRPHPFIHPSHSSLLIAAQPILATAGQGARCSQPLHCRAQEGRLQIHGSGTRRPVSVLSGRHEPSNDKAAWDVQVTNRVAFYDDGDDLRLEEFISLVKGGPEC